jgi:hypothetical protein
MNGSLARLVCATLVLTGCASTTAAGTGVTSMASAQPTQDCGSVNVSPNGSGPIPDPMLACLVGAARGHASARLSVTEHTTEGDPITTIYTSRADGKVTVVVDSRQDKFAGIGNHLTVQQCDHPTADRGRLLLSSCTDPTPTTLPG